VAFRISILAMVMNLDALRKNTKSQAAMEYMMTYGWAIVILTVVISLLYFFLLIPKTITPSSCLVETGLTCQDLNLGSFTSGGATVATFYFENEKTSAISNPQISMNYNGINVTTGACYPKYVKNGGAFICQVNLTLKSQINEFISGGLYVTVADCGLLANFLSTKNCTNAPTETLSGSYSGHTEAPISTYAYVTDNHNAKVDIIYTTNNVVVANVAVQSGPEGIAASIFTGYVYVANTGPGATGSISVINTSTHAVVNTITSFQSYPQDIVINPYGTLAYTTNPTSNTISVISLSNRTVVKTISLSGNQAPTGLALSPNGQYLYVADNNANSVITISTQNYTITSTKGTAHDQPYWIAVSPTQPYIWYASGVTNKAGGFSIANSAAITDVSVGLTPQFVSISPNGATVFVSNHGASTVSLINTTNDLVFSTIATGSSPQGSQALLSGSFLYVANEGAGTISVVSISTLATVNTITLPGSSAAPYGIAFASN
jgi:YVTN family beta-propeller protein